MIQTFGIAEMIVKITQGKCEIAFCGHRCSANKKIVKSLGALLPLAFCREEDADVTAVFLVCHLLLLFLSVESLPQLLLKHSEK